MQFIYFLALTERLIDDPNWTEEDKMIVSEHFERLSQLKKSGQLILAGKTSDRDPIGIVIFNAKDHDEAIEIMNDDPAIKKGIMLGKLRPYNVVLFGEKNNS